jgi:alcohol dehydrogenase class IV
MSDSGNELIGNWNYPTSIRFGAGRIRELPGISAELGIGRPLLVTDPGLAKLPMVSKAIGDCRTEGLDCGLFCDMKVNPTGDNVVDGVSVYREGGHDGVIAFGGGSSLDAGKAIALMVGQDRSLWEFEDIGDNWTRVKTDGIAPVVAVPTTAGTGSEVGRAAVITDPRGPIKRIIFHPRMLPAVVVADPALTLGLSAPLTAATGMDALSHSLEAFCAPDYHPMAEGIAIKAMGLVKEWLPEAYRDGASLTARSHMMAAASMGATSFQRGLGAMHALAHPLGALYDAHHGLLNAVLIPYVLVANEAALEPSMTVLSRYLGLPNPSFRAVLDWTLGLRRQIGIPEDLSQLGIDGECVDRVGQMAAEDPSSGGNPIPFSADEYSDLFRKALRGELE